MDGDLNGQNLVVEEGGGSSKWGQPSRLSIAERSVLPIYGHRAMNSTLGRVSVASIGSPLQALASTDRAITNVANERGKMGAVQNRLDVTEFSRRQILLQSSNAMLVQANASSVVALSLL